MWSSALGGRFLEPSLDPPSVENGNFEIFVQNALRCMVGYLAGGIYLGYIGMSRHLF
jgi:hypothetical protein